MMFNAKWIRNQIQIQHTYTHTHLAIIYCISIIKIFVIFFCDGYDDELHHIILMGFFFCISY